MRKVAALFVEDTSSDLFLLLSEVLNSCSTKVEAVFNKIEDAQCYAEMFSKKYHTTLYLLVLVDKHTAFYKVSHHGVWDIIYPTKSA